MTKRKKIFLGIFIAAITLSLVFGMFLILTNGFTDFGEILKAPEQTETMRVVGDDDKVLEPGVVHEFPSKLLFGATGTAAPITIQATVLPENATNKKVDWSLAWVDSSFVPEAGKTISSYLGIVPKDDGSLIADVNLISKFNSQIKIIVTSRDNLNAKAECIVDCVRGIFSCAVSIKGYCGGTEAWSDTLVPVLNYKSNLISTHGVDFHPDGRNCTYQKTLVEVADIVYTAGTVDDVFTYEISVEPSSNGIDGLVDKCREKGLVLTAGKIVLPVGLTNTNFSLSNSNIVTLFGFNNYSANWNTLVAALGSVENRMGDLIVNIKAAGGFSTFTYGYPMNIVQNSLPSYVSPVSSVSISNSTLTVA